MVTTDDGAPVVNSIRNGSHRAGRIERGEEPTAQNKAMQVVNAIHRAGGGAAIITGNIHVIIEAANRVESTRRSLHSAGVVNGGEEAVNDEIDVPLTVARF